MSVWSIGRKRITIMADFETTPDPDDCRVWAWGASSILNPEADFRYGNSMDSFIKLLQEYNSICYFHNLRFDGTFILYWLLTHGYKWVEENPKAKQFTTLIDKMGKFYSIKVAWTRGYATEFRDSYKRAPISVERLAISYGLDTLKGDLNHSIIRPIGHKLTAEELAYLKNDVVIVATVLAIQERQGMTKLTVGADALDEYKRIVGKTYFDRMFPVLSEPLDAEIRKAYRGGFTYASPNFQGKITGSGKVYDVNSLYPSVMYYNLLPYGEPIFHRGAPKPVENYPLWIMSVTITAKLKKDHIPCIQIKGSNTYVSTVYQESIDEPVTLYCTNVDWELWSEHYDIEVLTYNGTWYFQGMHDLFKEYIDKWSQIKANSSGGIREISKLFLNSLYGKFATNPDVTGKYPTLEDGVVKLIVGEENFRNPVYTAMGVFITAYARDVTIRSAQTLYPYFAYADTDSLHLVMNHEPTNIDIHKSRLGAWKHEYDFVQGLFVRAKCYSELKPDGTFHNAVAGLPVKKSKLLNFESFKLTAEGKQPVLGTRLDPKAVPGGIVLVERDYSLKL